MLASSAITTTALAVTATRVPVPATDRPSASDLLNPDFAAYARAFGGFGAIIERTEQFPEAFEQALASGVPAVLELRVDPEAMLPHATLSEIRRAAQAS